MRLWIADEIKINRKKIINKNILKIKVPSENISDLCCRVLCVQSSLRNLNSLWPDRKQALSAWEGKHHYMPAQKQTRGKCFSSPEPSQGKATWCLLITRGIRGETLQIWKTICSIFVWWWQWPRSGASFSQPGALAKAPRSTALPKEEACLCFSLTMAASG